MIPQGLLFKSGAREKRANFDMNFSQQVAPLSAKTCPPLSPRQSARIIRSPPHLLSRAIFDRFEEEK